MTSTQLVKIAKLNQEMDVARRAGDLPRWQQLIGQKQRLLESVYGRLAR